MNSTEIISLLQGSPLFKKMKSSLLASLLMKTSRVMLAPEQILIAPGQQNDHIYIILSGRLRVQITVHDTHPIALLGMSECVGEMSMFDDDHATSYVIAATDCELLSIPHAEVWTILNESLQASHNMLNILTSRIRSSNRILAESMESMHGYQALDYVNTISGIYNRRWMSENIARLTYRHIKNNQSCIFILLKAENLKQFTARFGSLGSDEAQRTIAQTMLRCLRPNDVATHISEDQFAILLPQTEPEHVNVVTDRLLGEISRTTIVTPSGDALPPVTLTVGITQCQSGDTFDSLLARANAAMCGA
jgi:diguanylate cyclase (GGDEF)-like protein